MVTILILNILIMKSHTLSMLDNKYLKMPAKLNFTSWFYLLKLPWWWIYKHLLDINVEINKIET